MSPVAALEVLPEVPCAGPAGELAVLTLEHLLDFRLCHRLPWWRAQGFAPAPPGPEAGLPWPWPDLPPGWPGPARGWARAFLEAPPEWGLGARADWILEQAGRPCLVFLGPPTPTLRLRARLLGTLVGLRGNAEPSLGWQGLPAKGLSGTWLGEWPRVQPLRLPLVAPAALAATLATLRRDLERPWPPARSAPRARCWDCPASRLCADFY
jgi:hypothetical protein